MQAGSGPELSKSRRAVVVTAVVAALIAVAVGWHFLGDEQAHPVQVVEGLPVSAVRLPDVSPIPVAASGPEGPTPVASEGAIDEIQVCGGRWVKLGPDGQPSQDELTAIQMGAMLEVGSSALAAMTSSGSLQAQAAASYFRSGRADLAVGMRARCGSAACAGAVDAWQAEGQGQRDALARLAQEANDSQIYAWAYRACQAVSGPPQGDCGAINASQWAHLDARNADPWLAAADEARFRKDPAALDDAMFHVANAERHDSGWWALAAQIMDHVPPDDANLLGTMGLVVQAIGLEATRGPGWQHAIQYCDAKELADSNRREICERMATVLAERSTTLLARSIGGALGKKVGWAAARIEGMVRQREAEEAVIRLQVERAQAEPVACGALRGELERVRNVARWGEVEAFRRDVVAAGKPVAELAADARRKHAEQVTQAKREEAAESAAASQATSASVFAPR